jgi:hypothetical protein
MIIFAVSFLITMLASYFALGYFNFHEFDISFYAGSALALFNVAVLYFSWKKILEKKNLVLSASVIVIKYPLLGFILYEVAHLKQISLGWFLVGMGTFIPAACLAGVWWSLTSPKIPEEILEEIPEVSEAEVDLKIIDIKSEENEINRGTKRE